MNRAALFSSPALISLSTRLLASCDPSQQCVGDPRRSRSWQRTLIVCQFNVLGDGKYAAKPCFNDSSTPAERTWSHRFPRIMQEIDAYGADIICLQEVQEPRYRDSFEPSFKQRGFSTHFARKAFPEETNFTTEEMFPMIAIRESSLSVLSEKVIRFDEEFASFLEESHPVLLKEKEYVEFVQKFKHSAVLVLCEHAVTRKRVVVASTHLHFDPRHSDVKAIQAAMLCRGIEKALKSWGCMYPVILCGDFNSLPSSSTIHGGPEGAYDLLTKGKLDPTHPDHPATSTPSVWSSPAREPGLPDLPVIGDSGLNLESAYKQALGQELPYTTCTLPFTGTLDYIFTNPKHIDIIDIMGLPPREKTPRAMPTADWPSDHFSIGAMIQLKK